jgi:hypothetical protein
MDRPTMTLTPVFECRLGNKISRAKLTGVNKEKYDKDPGAIKAMTCRNAYVHEVLKNPGVLSGVQGQSQEEKIGSVCNCKIIEMDLDPNVAFTPVINAASARKHRR